LGLVASFFHLVQFFASDEVQLAVDHKFQQHLVKSKSGAIPEHAVSLPRMQCGSAVCPSRQDEAASVQQPSLEGGQDIRVLHLFPFFQLSWKGALTGSSHGLCRPCMSQYFMIAGIKVQQFGHATACF